MERQIDALDGEHVVVRVTQNSIVIGGDRIAPVGSGADLDIVPLSKALKARYANLLQSKHAKGQRLTSFVVVDGDVPWPTTHRVLRSLKGAGFDHTRVVMSRSGGGQDVFTLGVSAQPPKESGAATLTVSLGLNGITVTYEVHQPDPAELVIQGPWREVIPLKPGHTLEASLKTFSSATTSDARASAAKAIFEAHNTRVLYTKLAAFKAMYPTLEHITLAIPESYPTEAMAMLLAVSQGNRKSNPNGAFKDDASFEHAALKSTLKESCAQGCLFPIVHPIVLNFLAPACTSGTCEK